jgi:hypothetical protein
MRSSGGGGGGGFDVITVADGDICFDGSGCV